MKAVMKSVSPRICDKVANGDCTILVSKTAPKCEVPFKCYIYMTATKERFYLWEYVTAYENSKGEILDGSQKVSESSFAIKYFYCTLTPMMGEMPTVNAASSYRLLRGVQGKMKFYRQLA